MGEKFSSTLGPKKMYIYEPRYSSLPLPAPLKVFGPPSHHIIPSACSLLVASRHQVRLPNFFDDELDRPERHSRNVERDRACIASHGIFTRLLFGFQFF